MRPAAGLIWLVSLASAATAADDAGRLRFLAALGDGTTIEQRADDAVNPASVVKVGTSLWALHSYGADHRWETVFAVAGDWDRHTGILDGDLVIVGGADPDFQWENTFLAARALNRAGLTTVRGRLVVQGTFWNGWEHGVEHRATDPVERGRRMGRRIVDSLDPRRWSTSHANTWKAMCRRRGLDPEARPRVRVLGGVAVGAAGTLRPVVVHRSNPLADVLRRFNVYSNNDIVRIAEPLGGPEGLESFLFDRLGSTGIELATASGERRNRMTPRQMVALIAELRAEAAVHGLELRRLLPVIGCDDGSTRRMFPALAAPPLTGAITCKTGTLTTTDGGVAVLAGTFAGTDGVEVTFAVAAPGAGGRLQHWRRLEQRWVLSLIDARGGAVTLPCDDPLPFSDTHAIVEVLVGQGQSVSRER